MAVQFEFVRQCRQSPTPKHHLMIIPGLFSHGDVVMYGKQLPATPNGRKAGEPISHSSEPDPGFAIGLNSFSPVLKARIGIILRSFMSGQQCFLLQAIQVDQSTSHLLMRLDQCD